METEEAGAVASGAAVAKLIASKAVPSRSQKRLARKLQGAVFMGEGAKRAARARRAELRAGRHHFRYARLNLDGEIVFVVEDRGPREEGEEAA